MGNSSSAGIASEAACRQHSKQKALNIPMYSGLLPSRAAVDLAPPIGQPSRSGGLVPRRWAASRNSPQRPPSPPHRPGWLPNAYNVATWNLWQIRANAPRRASMSGTLYHSAPNTPHRPPGPAPAGQTVKNRPIRRWLPHRRPGNPTGFLFELPVLPRYLTSLPLLDCE